MIQVRVQTYSATSFVYRHGVPWGGGKHASATVNTGDYTHTCRCGAILPDYNWPDNWFDHKARHIDLAILA